MNKSKLLALGAETTLIAAILHRVIREFFTARASRIAYLTHKTDGLAVGVGTVRTVDEVPEAAGERRIWIEVFSVHGDTFIGRLVHDDGDTDLSTLRPGLLVLVAFDPEAREQLSLPDDVLAVRASGLTLV